MKGKQRECKGIPHALKKLCRMKILPCVPTRYVLAVMVFFGMINVYTLRFDLSLTIVPMTNEAFNSTANLVKLMKSIMINSVFNSNNNFLITHDK